VSDQRVKIVALSLRTSCPRLIYPLLPVSIVLFAVLYDYSKLNLLSPSQLGRPPFILPVFRCTRPTFLPNLSTSVRSQGDRVRFPTFSLTPAGPIYLSSSPHPRIRECARRFPLPPSLPLIPRLSPRRPPPPRRAFSCPRVPRRHCKCGSARDVEK
jgi:hypothetical protein